MMLIRTYRVRGHLAATSIRSASRGATFRPDLTLVARFQAADLDRPIFVYGVLGFDPPRRCARSCACSRRPTAVASASNLVRMSTSRSGAGAGAIESPEETVQFTIEGKHDDP